MRNEFSCRIGRNHSGRDESGPITQQADKHLGLSRSQREFHFLRHKSSGLLPLCRQNLYSVPWFPEEFQRHDQSLVRDQTEQHLPRQDHVWSVGSWVLENHRARVVNRQGLAQLMEHQNGGFSHFFQERRRLPGQPQVQSSSERRNLKSKLMIWWFLFSVKLLNFSVIMWIIFCYVFYLIDENNFFFLVFNLSDKHNIFFA